LKDSINYKLIIKYIVKPRHEINRDYAELVNDNELQLVFIGDAFINYRMIETTFTTDADTLYLTNYLTYKDGNHYASDVLVERIFSDKTDSTIIHRNNYPEYESEILEASKSYSKDLFNKDILGGKKGYLKKLFIRFYLRRRIENCCHENIF